MLAEDLSMQFHLLAFEGPDDYARAGGIASRVSGLAQALANAGFETHLWFVGDPELPGHEMRDCLRLHRWSQWISRYHQTGVYDGEEGKRADYAASLPPFLLREVLLPHLQEGGRAVILAEEWHTADAILHLDWLLQQAQVREQVTIFWNANNTFGFQRINWGGLAAAATLTTVSRYMKQLMQGFGVTPLVMPNGLSLEALASPPREAVAALRTHLRHRTVVTKVARWDPDKRWLLAIDTVGVMKELGWKPLLIARGGVEAHGHEVLASGMARGLHVVELTHSGSGIRGLLQSLTALEDVDMVSLRSPLDAEACRVLFQGSHASYRTVNMNPLGWSAWRPWRSAAWPAPGALERTTRCLVIMLSCCRLQTHANLLRYSGLCAGTGARSRHCDGPHTRQPSNIPGPRSSSASYCHGWRCRFHSGQSRQAGSLIEAYGGGSSCTAHSGCASRDQQTTPGWLLTDSQMALSHVDPDVCATSCTLEAEAGERRRT